MARKTSSEKSRETATFSITAPTAQSVQLMGDFTHWKERPINLHKEGSGVPVEPKLNPNGPAPRLHMPAFKDLLSPAQMNDLVAYLISLKPKGEDLGF